MTTFAALKTSNTIKITVMRKLILTMVLLLSAVAIMAQDRTITVRSTTERLRRRCLTRLFSCSGTMPIPLMSPE